MNMEYQGNLKHIPPLLMATGLLVWGWQTDYLFYSIVMAVLLEMPHWLNWRVNIEEKEFNQLSDLSSVLFIIIIVYIFSSYSVHGIFKILELAPYIFFLLILAQQYSQAGKIKLSALFISMRKLDKNALSDYVDAIDISLPYFFVCLISASTGYKEQKLFFIIISILFLIVLWHLRPKHYHPLKWLLPLLFVFISAFFMQGGLKTLQTLMERQIAILFDQFIWYNRDINRTTTAIGSLGRLKLSDRIMLRVKSKDPIKLPMLLREATYNSYDYGVWSNLYSSFETIDQDPVKLNWTINKNPQHAFSLIIGSYLDQEVAILPIPHNTFEISGNSILELNKSQYDSIRVESKPGWINYQTKYSLQDSFDIEPTQEDIVVPDNYHADFKRLAQQLGLSKLTGMEIVSKINTYFADNFYYSITQNQRYPKGRYLSNFLFKDKKGHCEYFATATALLLRTAGIPTRYTVGFSVQEYNAWQDMFIVRARHAHSWVNYYLDGQWHIIDTTPSVWAPMEAEDHSILEPFFDFISWLKYLYSSDDIAKEEENKLTDYLLYLLIPLFLFIIWRFKSRRDVIKTDQTKLVQTSQYIHGSDSPLFKLIDKLEKTADKKKTGETLSHWLNRILPTTFLGDYLDAVTLHYHYRFNKTVKSSVKTELDEKTEQLMLKNIGVKK